MTKRDIDSKINQVKKYLAQAKRYTKITLSALKNNDEKKLAVERILFLVSQSSIDLAESYCNYKGFRRPSSMHESIEILKENKVISEKLNLNLIKMVGFRNVLTHGYSKIDYEKVYDVLKNGLKDIQSFVKILSK